MIIKYKKICVCCLCLIIFTFCNVFGIYAEEEIDRKDTDDPIIVVSLGDSYSSGEGIEPFYGQDEKTENKVKNPDWLAHRSTLSWPGQLHIDGLEGTLADHKDVNWFFVAASGATTDNLLKAQKKKYDKDGISGTEYLDPQLDIFDQFEENTVDYVTLTFGGNDVGFADIIKTAALSVSFITPRKITDKLNETWDEFYANGGIKDNIRRAYENIADKAGENAKIIVAGYPKLLEKNGKGCFFSKTEAKAINSNVTKFNEALEKIVDSCYDNGINIYFVSVEDAFDGHEAYSKIPYINKIQLNANKIQLTQKEDLEDNIINASAYSIHPNKEGAEVYAKCVQAKMDELESEDADKSVTVHSDISYQTHIENIGWIDIASNGATSGTMGESKRMEGLKISLTDMTGISGSVEYCSHVQNIGWMDWAKDGEQSGVTGESKGIEAVQIKLSGDISNYYDVYYRVHVQNMGWLGWAKNGESAGTTGYSYHVEAIQIQLIKKGEAAPESSVEAFKKNEETVTAAENSFSKETELTYEIDDITNRKVTVNDIKGVFDTASEESDGYYCRYVCNSKDLYLQAYESDESFDIFMMDIVNNKHFSLMGIFCGDSWSKTSDTISDYGAWYLHGYWNSESWVYGESWDYVPEYFVNYDTVYSGSVVDWHGNLFWINYYVLDDVVVGFSASNNPTDRYGDKMGLLKAEATYGGKKLSGWRQAYLDIVKQSYESDVCGYEVDWPVYYKYQYALAYVDDDDVPELLQYKNDVINNKTTDIQIYYYADNNVTSCNALDKVSDQYLAGFNEQDAEDFLSELFN